jgi:oligoribonuclease (3'-5' exoribonuclease)
MRDDDNEQRTMSMTALQDWLTFRPVDQSSIMEMVCRPFRAALGTVDVAEESEELKLLTPGVERC